MTPNLQCAGLDTTLVDALHTMHDGKFLHLHVTDCSEYDTIFFYVSRFTMEEIEAVIIATSVHTFFSEATHLVNSTHNVGH